MNRAASIVHLLVQKDWHFFRWALLGYVLAGLGALVPIATGGKGGFYFGSVLLITVLISIGIHLTMATVVIERQEHTLAFVMSLPVSPRDYTGAKIIANLTIFAASWLLLLVATVAVIAGRAALPDGLIPYAVAILVHLFAAYVLMLSTAIVSESLSWTIGAVITGNLSLQAVLYGLGNQPEVEALLGTNTIAWPSPITTLIGAEVAAIAGMVALTFYLQGRKTHFV